VPILVSPHYTIGGFLVHFFNETMGCQEFHFSRRHPKAQDVTEQKILVVMSKAEEAMLQGFATRPISTSFQFIPEWINSFCFLLL
jgi:hypothetical protein